VEFVRRETATRWSFIQGRTARIDYLEELGGGSSDEAEITGVIGIHPTFDLALLRVERKPATTPLTVASTFPNPTPGRKLFVVGYPAWDGRRNDPAVMMNIFSNVFNIKRLQPGELRQVFDQGILHHDCSTLGGNSGSCVVDLETGQVIGLHFGGRFLEVNQAVALWNLTKDPLLKKAKVNFA
jgi:S1-C subfamily serine protease